ncbi:MAG: DUF5721 family protein [Eubacteriales bacterium]|nr:DUF5721 family protein [Eubacteriales bacterium]
MTAFQIRELKNFMGKLLAGDCFDSFLLEEASVSAAVTYQIDGRVNRDFFEGNGEECPDEFIPWSSVRGICYDMIKGRRTPVRFKFVLHLMPAYVPGVMKGADPSLDPGQVKALVLTVHYDGGTIRLTTGTAFSSFVPDRTLDAQWDKTMRQFLSKKGISYTEN